MSTSGQTLRSERVARTGRSSRTRAQRRRWGEHGLVCHVDQWVLIDWAALHLADTSSCLNAQWARALLEFADMSEWLGDHGRAAWARGLHAEVREAFELFWDEARGSYVDHAVDGEPQLPMSQHGGATAVWAKLVPDDSTIEATRKSKSSRTAINFGTSGVSTYAKSSSSMARTPKSTSLMRAVDVSISGWSSSSVRMVVNTRRS